MSDRTGHTRCRARMPASATSRACGASRSRILDFPFQLFLGEPLRLDAGPVRRHRPLRRRFRRTAPSCAATVHLDPPGRAPP